MNEILRFMRLEAGQTEVLPVWEVALAVSLTFVLSILIGLVYRYTHRSPAYSQSYVQTLVLTSMVTCLIMIVIGSNIARAFSLVGALSIIRFRNAIKETRDVGYIFMAMAIAMAAGTRFYTIALLGTGMMSTGMLFLHFANFGASRVEPERMVRVRIEAGKDPIQLLEDTLEKLFLSYSLVLIESVRQGLYLDAVFSVRQRPGITSGEVVERLGAANGNLKVSYHAGLHTEDL